MSHTATSGRPAGRYPRLARTRSRIMAELDQIGAQTRFYFLTLARIPDAVINYRPELLRLIAQMGLGSVRWLQSVEPS